MEREHKTFDDGSTWYRLHWRTGGTVFYSEWIAMIGARE